MVFRLNTVFTVFIESTPVLRVRAEIEPDNVCVGPFQFWSTMECEWVGFDTENDVVEALRALAAY